MEIWKPIPNFSRYEASNLGRLRALRYKNSDRIEVLKPALSFNGYLKTMLLDDNKKYRSWTVHKFIALAFFGERQDGAIQINHKDGNKQNNNIENLEYVTASQNVKHAFDNGLMKPKRGELNGMAKLTEKDVIEIREYVANFKGRYYGRKELAEKYGISESHVKDLVSGRRGIWSHV